jgi:hypothetical protein
MVPAGPKQLIPRPPEHAPESAPENTQTSRQP